MKKRSKKYFLTRFTAAVFFCSAIVFSITGCSKNSGSANAGKKEELYHYRLGLQKYEEGDYESAIIYYQKALQINPESKKALLDLGILYEDYKKDTAKAMDVYQKFLLLNPEGDKAEMVKGWLMKLAVNEDGLSGSSAASSGAKGAILDINQKTLEENKNLRKEIETIRGQMLETREENETLKSKIGKTRENGEELKEAQNEIKSLEKKLEKLTKEAPGKDFQQKTALEAALKQKAIQLEQEKADLAKGYEEKITALESKIREQEEENRAFARQIDLLKKDSVSGRKELALELERLEKNKTKSEAISLKYKTELDRLKVAFATATKERARLSKMLEEKEETIGALKGQIAKLAQQKSFEDSDRRAYEKQVTLLKRKVQILEEDKAKYILLAKQAQKNESRLLERSLSDTSSPVPAKESFSPPVQPKNSGSFSRDYELVTYHRVKRGETLMMIAGYDHIYGDRGKWKVIYEANKTNIDDPNVLVPGQILLVPR